MLDFRQERVACCDEIRVLYLQYGLEVPVDLLRDLAKKYGRNMSLVRRDLIAMSFPKDAPCAVSLWVKEVVFERDCYTCQYCGSKGRNRQLVIDHVYPRRLGGLHYHYNLVTACHPCNSRKRNQVWTPKNIHDLRAFSEENYQLIITNSVKYKNR